MKKSTWAFIIAIVIVFLAILIWRGPRESSSLKQLAAIEVKEYNGEKLSSISDFRENSIKGTQYVNTSSYWLKITGLVENPREYTYENVLDGHQHYTKLVTLNCVEGWSVKLLWEGILVKDLLADAKPMQNAKTVIFHAYDRYTTSFPIEYITGNDIMMAYKMNNVTLPPERGYPFELVAESKWGYKWIKWITEIELSDNADYKGYWESKGYSNSGNLNESFF
jgi:DMSO/TMAO reductase YedYZ molybdopterin-dependent catalytic subunit